MRRRFPVFVVVLLAAACSPSGAPPRAAELAADADLPRHAILPTIEATRQAVPAPDATSPPPGGEPQPTGKAPQVVAAWAREKYTHLPAAGGRIALMTNPVLAKTLKGDEVYQLAVGSRYPLATVGPLARRMLVVD